MKALKKVISKKKEDGGSGDKDSNVITVDEEVVEKLEQLRIKEIVPDSLDQYQLKETVGTGTFGRVRVIRNPENGKYYALKQLKKKDIIRLKQQLHVKHEKDILNDIFHPNIVNLYKCIQDRKYIYFIMEYVVGGELFTHLRRAGRFSNAMARFYAAQIVLAFEYLHSKDIIYRDLKPENLLLDKDGNVKITDFGFAKVVKDRTWTLCGTPEYIAPEIIQSKGHNKSVDWWALGILIYEMLAGYPPFNDDDPFKIYEKILRGRYTVPSFFDPTAKDLIRKLLSADRTRRLGCMKKQAGDVKNHPFFKSIDWDALYHGKIRAPFIPPFTSEGDTINFDRYPEPPEENPDDFPPDPYANIFADF